METLENGGEVVLWSGWSIKLPRACFERNSDGSWVAWGQDWTVDVSIIDTSGDSDGNDASPSQLLGSIDLAEAISGAGWIGSRKLITEIDNGRQIFRIVTKLCGINSVALCWISYFDESKSDFANSLLNGVIYQRQ